MSDLISRQDAIDVAKDVHNAVLCCEVSPSKSLLEVVKRLESLPSATCDDCIWHVCNYNKIDWEGEDGYISRQAAIDAIRNRIEKSEVGESVDHDQVIADIESLPSAKPKRETVLCALADRTCPFQGKEYAWCLTCPHISEEDRALVKKAVAEPKTGKWVRSHVGTIVEGFYCSRCGKHGYQTDDFCPNCGADMRGEEHE